MPQKQPAANVAVFVCMGSIFWPRERLVGSVDGLVRRLRPGAHLSPLAVGLGIYLPTQSLLMCIIGSVVGWYYDQRAERRAMRKSNGAHLQRDGPVISGVSELQSLAVGQHFLSRRIF